MSKLKGTKTLENLMKAFAGESQARNRYTMFASIANKEGYPTVEATFLETAENERLHAKAFYEQIAKSIPEKSTLPIQMTATYPVVLADTFTNLEAAAEGEYEEFAILYKEFGDTAKQEGFKEIGVLFHTIAIIEHDHELRYRAFAKAVKEGTLFKSNQDENWKCVKCGYVHVGKDAPKICPVCAHPQGYFERYSRDWKNM